MLKRLAIIAVFLATLAPMPGQAIKPAAQGGDKSQSHSQGNKSAPAPMSALVSKPIDPAPAQPDRAPIAGEDKEHTVKLTSLPPVTLTDKPKSFWDHVLDWGPWIFNCGLVIVGVLQVVLLKWTWGTISRQADLMATQDYTAREKQRARLSIAFPPDPPETLDTRFSNSEFMGLFTDVVNDGESNAYDVEASGYVKVTKTLEGVPFTTRGESLQIPSVIREAPPDKPVRVSMSPSGFDTYREIADEDMEMVRAGVAYLHMVGEVCYTDVFGDAHTTPFHYFWGAIDESLREPGDTTVGYWSNISKRAT